ncbi:MAG: DUF4340 domain-containing protein, partial [Verrucomicrobia bacterium]|nr:DUF4340 domain-containing protein [Verrucomicrobiota bacterium]
MNSKQTVWLVALAAALLAFILLFERHTEDSERKPPLPPEKLFPDFDPGAITRVEIAFTNRLVRAERVAQSWTLTAPVPYPADAVSIENLLRVCAQLRPQTVVPPREVHSLSAFGLMPPQAELRLWQGARQMELRIGYRTAVGNRVYAKAGGAPGVAVVDATLLQLLPQSADDWRERTLLSLKGLDFDRLKFRSGPREVVFQNDAASGLWHITNPPPVKRVDAARLANLLAQFANWPVRQFVTDDPRAELERFGLAPPDAELAFQRGTNDLAVVQFGKSPTNAAALVYARRLSHTNVVLVPRDGLDLLRAPTWDFRDHRLVDKPADGVDRIEARAAEPFVLLREPNGSWRIAEPADLFADTELVEKFLTDLFALEAVEEE